MHTLWLIAISVKVLTLLLLLRRRMYVTYPLLLAFLAFSATKSIVLAFLYSSPRLYGWAYIITEPVALLMLALAAVEAFWRMTEAYPNFRTYTLVIVCAAGTLAAGALWLVRMVAPPDYVGYVGKLVHAERYAVLGMAVVLAASVLFVPRFTTVPVRPAATANCLCLVVYLIGMSVTTLMMQSRATYHASGWVSTGSSLVVCLAWAIFITPKGNVMPLAEFISDQRLKQAEDRLRDYFNRQAVRWHLDH